MILRTATYRRLLPSPRAKEKGWKTQYTLWLRPRMQPLSDSSLEGITPVTENREKYWAGLRSNKTATAPWLIKS